MLTVLRLRVLAGVAAVMIPAFAGAQSFGLARPSPAPDGASVLVNITGTPRPDAAAFADTALWVVVARTTTAPAGTQIPLAGVAATQHYGVTGQLRLTFAKPIDVKSLTELDAVCLLGKPARVTWRARKPAGGLGVFPVDRREKADVALIGSWVTGVNAVPLYNLDLQAGAPIVDVAFAGEQWRWSLTSSWKTAEKRNLDPDSYAIASRVALIFPFEVDDAGPYLDLAWDVGRLEFSRKDEASNFVTAPTATFSRKLLGALRPDKTVLAAIDFEPSLGFELGANLRNTIVAEGYGAIVRIMPGAALSAVFPGALGLLEIRWTSKYRARMLAAREPLVDAREDETRTSIVGGTRHEWTDELLLKVVPLVGFTIKHEYGATPPAFKLLDHRFSAGVAIMWAWKQ